MVIEFQGKMVLINERSLVKYIEHKDLKSGLRLEETGKNHGLSPETQVSSCFCCKLVTPICPKSSRRRTCTTLPLPKVHSFENCLDLPKNSVGKGRCEGETLASRAAGGLTLPHQTCWLSS